MDSFAVQWKRSGRVLKLAFFGAWKYKRLWTIAIVPLLISFLFLFISCKKEKKFVEPEFILKKWTKSIKTFNYNEYKKYEAYPKSAPVFREIFSEYYMTDLMVTTIGDLDKKKVFKDHIGNSYIKRKISFESTEVKRKTGKPVHIIRGDVMFVKFIDGKRQDDGWLMSNRTIVRVKR